MNSTYCILQNYPRQNCQSGKELNNFFPLKQKRRPQPFLLYLSNFFDGSPDQWSSHQLIRLWFRYHNKNKHKSRSSISCPTNKPKNKSVQYTVQSAPKLYPELEVENLVMSICFQAKLISYYSTGEHNVLYEYIRVFTI